MRATRDAAPTPYRIVVPEPYTPFNVQHPTSPCVKSPGASDVRRLQVRPASSISGESRRAGLRALPTTVAHAAVATVEQQR